MLCVGHTTYIQKAADAKASILSTERPGVTLSYVVRVRGQVLQYVSSWNELKMFSERNLVRKGTPETRHMHVSE